MIIPAAEQHRKDYVFLVPTSFRDNYFVLAKPVSGTFKPQVAAHGARLFRLTPGAEPSVPQR
jgi:hypothetical protein